MSGRHVEPAEGSDVSPLTEPADRSDLDRTVQIERPEVVAHEERAHVGTELHESGRVRVRKHVETYPVEETVSRSVERADTSERVEALEGDTGEVETLPDGSVSIPVFEEVLVVTKKLVVRERVIVRKHTVVDEHTLETELRREHVSVEADGGIEVEDRTAVSPTTGTTTGTTGTTDVTRDIARPQG
ncbi:MAG: hypothetical protein JWN84_2655 [Nocardioides sp.]|jgi:uncharacterized protein (TIGR02271 family)|nr:hypothetical protein [Nocardioides sp.]